MARRWLLRSPPIHTHAVTIPTRPHFSPSPFPHLRPPKNNTTTAAHRCHAVGFLSPSPTNRTPNTNYPFLSSISNPQFSISQTLIFFPKSSFLSPRFYQPRTIWKKRNGLGFCNPQKFVLDVLVGWNML